jgi:hypothetical protein
MFTIKKVKYKKANADGYTRLCLYVRCNTTGESLPVNGNSEVGVDFYKAKVRVRFNREYVDSENNLTKGLIEPTDVTAACLVKAMSARGLDTKTISTMKKHFCWNTIISKKIPKNIDPDHWFHGLVTVFPYMRMFDYEYCLNDEVVGLKRYLNNIGVYFSASEVHGIVEHMGFGSPELFLKNVVELVNVPNLSTNKILKLLNSIPTDMIPSETRRMLRICVHIKDRQTRTGSVYVPLPHRTLWNSELDLFPTLFHENSSSLICMVSQRESEARFVAFIQSLERENDQTNERLSVSKLLNEGQVNAVDNTLCYPVSLINGPPGSGKTFITKEIIKQLHHMNVYFLAPTGKAVYRLQEAVGTESGCYFYTIHKFKGMVRTQRLQNNPMVPNLFIIDEASMLGHTHMNLLWSIWKVVKPSGIVFLGDTNQLPPIDPGDLFRDLLLSNKIPQTTLTERLRQKNDCDGLMGAIIAVENKRVPTQYDDTFQHLRITEQIAERAHEYLFPRYTYDDFRKGNVMVIGSKNDTVNRLSGLIRATLVPESRNQENPEFCDKDLVRCNSNLYNDDYEILRGTPGVVMIQKQLAIQKEVERFVIFENNGNPELVDKNLELEFNYAISCHKAQGSEADHVVFVLENHVCAPLHKRNLLYTAMTRAKKTLTIIGPMDVLQYMVTNEPVKRCTTMHEHFL